MPDNLIRPLDRNLSDNERMFTRGRNKRVDRRVRVALISFVTVPLAVLAGCGASDTSRFELNARKERIYNYAKTLCATDQSSTTTTGTGHPKYLKEPYPTQTEMEQAIGKADFSETGNWANFSASLKDDGELPTLYWWEKDSSWTVPTRMGGKKGFREIIIAAFDNAGRLRVLEVLDAFGMETVGRGSSEWERQSM